MGSIIQRLMRSIHKSHYFLTISICWITNQRPSEKIASHTVWSTKYYTEEISFCTEPEFGTHEPEFGSFSRYGDPYSSSLFPSQRFGGMDLLRSIQYRKDRVPR
uniref:Putative ovule protein n=1 Tax=Solanum chacoense TaxID=4108 RepID=A0A0V0H9R2_SOLCH